MRVLCFALNALNNMFFGIILQKLRNFFSHIFVKDLQLQRVEFCVWMLFYLNFVSMFTRMRKADCAVVATCMSVCPSVTRRYSVELDRISSNIFHCRVATPFQLFLTILYRNTLTGTPYRECQMERGQQLCCRREAARCFVSVSTQLQQQAYYNYVERNLLLSVMQWRTPLHVSVFRKTEERRVSDPETVFHVVHKLCVSWTFLFVSIALFIVCEIKQSCIVYV